MNASRDGVERVVTPDRDEWWSWREEGVRQGLSVAEAEMFAYWKVASLGEGADAPAGPAPSPSGRPQGESEPSGGSPTVVAEQGEDDVFHDVPAEVDRSALRQPRWREDEPPQDQIIVHDGQLTLDAEHCPTCGYAYAEDNDTTHECPPGFTA